MIRLLVVEDHNLVRQGIIKLLNGQQDMEVVAEAENGRKALDLLENGTQADIVLADFNMPEMDGVALTEHILLKYNWIKVIILTMHVRDEFIDRALKAGAKGYVLKNGDFNELYKGIRKVFQGEIHVTSEL